MQIEKRLDLVNQIGRSAEFIADAENMPLLRKSYWLTEDLWNAIKVSPKISPRLERFVEWMSDVRNVPGAERLVNAIKSCLEFDNAEGHIYHLERASEYAKEGKLAEIGRSFEIPVALPDTPVKMMIGDADLALTDGTIVEVKFRNGTLGLSEQDQLQLLKYQRAVKDGLFTRIRVECNGRVGQKFRDRCATLSYGEAPIEIVENLNSNPSAQLVSAAASTGN